MTSNGFSYRWSCINKCEKSTSYCFKLHCVAVCVRLVIKLLFEEREKPEIATKVERGQMKIGNYKLQISICTYKYVVVWVCVTLTLLLYLANEQKVAVQKKCLGDLYLGHVSFLAPVKKHLKDRAFHILRLSFVETRPMLIYILQDLLFLSYQSICNKVNAYYYQFF